MLISMNTNSIKNDESKAIAKATRKFLRNGGKITKADKTPFKQYTKRDFTISNKK